MLFGRNLQHDNDVCMQVGHSHHVYHRQKLLVKAHFFTAVDYHII